MLEVKGRNIYLTRGDSATLNLKIKDSAGNPYIFAAETEIVFSVKKYVNDADYVMQKKIYNSATVELSPEDTAVSVGEYVYDVELRTAEKVYTIIPPSKICICEEVTAHD